MLLEHFVLIIYQPTALSYPHLEARARPPCLGDPRVSVKTLALWSALYNSIRLLYTGCVFAMCCKLFFLLPPSSPFPLPALFSFLSIPSSSPGRSVELVRQPCGGGSDFIGTGRARSHPSHAAQLRSARPHGPLYKELNLPNFTLFPERSQLARRGALRKL